MAFSKAIQHTNPEAHAEYVRAHLEYGIECSAFLRAKKLWKNSTIPEERLKWFEARERRSLAGKAFTAATDKYARECAMKKFKDKGIDISGLTLAQVAEIEIPMSLREIMAQTGQERASKVVDNDPELRKLRDQLLQSSPEEPEPVKTKFLSSVDLDDPTKEF